MDLEKTMEFILEQQAVLSVRQLEHDREMAEIRKELGRAIRLGVREIRSERKKRQELDEKITKLAAAQLVGEEKHQELQGQLAQLAALLQSFLKNTGNGKH